MPGLTGSEFRKIVRKAASKVRLPEVPDHSAQLLELTQTINVLLQAVQTLEQRIAALEARKPA
jgi:hypothetical protein